MIFHLLSLSAVPVYIINKWLRHIYIYIYIYIYIKLRSYQVRENVYQTVEDIHLSGATVIPV